MRGKGTLAICFAVVSVMLLAATGGYASEIKLYVSPDGDDAWSGRLAKANAGRTDGPLASFEGARDAVRRLRGKRGALPGPVTVVFADGLYTVSRTIEFGPEDSGTAQKPITYEAAPGANVVFSSGRSISGFKRDGSGKYWVAEVGAVASGEWYFRQLFVGGRRAVRARHPNAHDYWFTMERQLEPYRDGIAVYRNGDIKAWPELKDIEMVLMRVWNISIFRLASVDEKTRTVRLATGVKEASMRRWRGDKRYYLENALRFLDAPGEWFLDRKRGLLYLKPFDEKRFDGADVIAPTVELLMTLKGTSEKPVAHIRFRRLTFAHTRWTLPETGYNGHQGDVAAGASIVGDFVRSVEFRECTFRQLGRYALWLRKACRDNVVTRCEFFDNGGGAIELGENRRTGRESENLTTRNELSHNHIHHNGQVWRGSCGIWVGPASYTSIVYNHVHDHTYTGISVGWTWADHPSAAHHNRVEHNHIHDVMQMMGDGGGVYTLGRQDGTVIRYNVIHDILGWNAQGNGIYTDQGSSGLVIENNLVARTGWGGIGCGTNDNVVRNNIVAFAGRCGLGTYNGNRRRWLRNVVYQKERLLLDARLKGEDNRFDYNLYWHVGDPDPVFPGGYTFGEWQDEMGQDKHSLVADPLFKDVARGDFNLRPDSPAIRLGFKPFALPVIGPGGPDYREDKRLCALFKLRPPRKVLRPRKDRAKIIARPLKGRITLDGRKDAGEWDNTERIEMRETPVGTVHAEERFKSYLHVTYDKTHLYVLIEVPCDVKKLRADGATWPTYDGAEVCLQNVSGKKHGPVFVIRGYASGDSETVTMSGELRRARRLGEAIAYGAEVAGDYWRGEWKIPFAECGIDPEKDTKIWFNAGVRRAHEGKWIIWTGTGGSTHELYNAGDLVLGPAPSGE